MEILFKKKGKKGPKCKLLAAALTFVAASSFAASNSVTISSTLAPYKSSAPVIGYISATTTSTTNVRLALPSSTKTLNSFVCQTRDTNGVANPRDYDISGTDIVVSTATGMASGTLAVGDRINCLVNFER